MGRSLPSASRSVPGVAHVAVHVDSPPVEVWLPWSKGCLSVLALGRE